jgi:VWFA-related protein
MGDAEATLLDAVFAIVIPAASFDPSAVQSGALLKVRLWEGSSLWHSRSFISISSGALPRSSLHGYLTVASPEAMVAQFHKNARKPATEFPLCAASTRTLRVAGASDTLADFDKADVLVYAIQYVSRKEANAQPAAGRSYAIVAPEEAQNSTGFHPRADRFLLDLCRHSGGLLYVARTGSNLNEIFSGIAENLRHQYTIRFSRADARQDGSFHNIRVEVGRPGAKVRARTGYRDD